MEVRETTISRPYLRTLINEDNHNMILESKCYKEGIQWQIKDIRLRKRRIDGVLGKLQAQTAMARSKSSSIRFKLIVVTTR